MTETKAKSEKPKSKSQSYQATAEPKTDRLTPPESYIKNKASKKKTVIPKNKDSLYINNNKKNALVKSKKEVLKKRDIPKNPELLEKYKKELKDIDFEYKKFGINQNQELFIREYLKETPRNATKAYMTVYDVDYNTAGVQSSLLLDNPKIKARATALESEFIAKHYISRDNVLSGLWDVYRKCINAEPVTDMKGNHVKDYITSPSGDKEVATVWKFDSKGAVAALQAIGRYLGLFNADTSGQANVNVTVELAATRNYITEQMTRLQGGNMTQTQTITATAHI